MEAGETGPPVTAIRGTSEPSEEAMDGTFNLPAWDTLPLARRRGSRLLAEHYEAIVVGAGPAGNAAALGLARAGLDVLQLERGEYPGAKNVRGAILYAPALEDLLPGFDKSAPLERAIVEHWSWALDDHTHSGTRERASDAAAGRPSHYTVLRAPFDSWFSATVKEAGVHVLCATAVTDLVREDDGRVVGVRTDRNNRAIFADVIVLADGVEALVARRSGLREELQPLDVAMTVKEIRQMPSEVIEARFGLDALGGVMLEASAAFTRTLPGIGFIYTNRNSLSVGIGCLVSDVCDDTVAPSELLERFKRHPSIRTLLEGSEPSGFAAQLFPEGGYRSRPRLFGDGWLTCGDAAQRNDALHRDGSTMALTSGRLAAETIVELKRHGRPMTARHLSLYRDKLERSPVLRDLRRLRPLTPPLREGRQGVAADPHRLAQANQELARARDSARTNVERAVLSGIARRRPPAGPINGSLL
jgi:electron transfer flavoprotein-quinone oxidoreductase